MYSAHFSEQMMILSHDFLKIPKSEGSVPVPAHRQPQGNILVCFQMLLYKDKPAVISSVPVPQMKYAIHLTLHSALSNQKYTLSVIS